MHAENVESAVRRLTQKPMDISPAYISLMNIVLSVQRVHLVKNGVKKAFRRILSINEVVDFEQYVNPFKWDPIKDEQQIHLESSELIPSMALKLGVNTEELIKELYRRKDVLHYMVEKKIRSYRDVAAIIAEYYARPKAFYEKIMAGEEVKPIVLTKDA
jgi:archaeal flagellar protein FlaI